ncbi:hypothetical protein C482_04264 [Natrialba chahannaoensis JCM 10990]|uniref:Tripartite tricarboxylate transporter TctB family protein n=2 Tax=Natrialba chahannaoensis TaxID=68911 RepID=M0AXH0_9EURY|nr:hypothetical protein C482_04264 [Natrialba chahannaoensis JCM 10990]
MEHVLLTLFLVVGVYMYWGASEFSAPAQTFPRLMSGATIIFSLLLLARNYLQTAGPVLGAALGVYFTYIGGTAFLETGDGLLYLLSGLALVFASVVFRERVGAAIESFVAEPVQMMGGDDASQRPETDDDETSAEQRETDEQDDEGDSTAMYVYEIDDPRGPVVTGALCTVYMLLTFTIGMLYATPIFVGLWVLWIKMEMVRAVTLTVLSFVIAILFYEFVEPEIGTGWLTGWQPPTPTELLTHSPHTMDVLVLGYTTDAMVWGGPLL